MHNLLSPKLGEEMKIIGIEKASVLEEMGVRPGDKLLTINGNPIEDILDYKFFSEEPTMLVEIETAQGDVLELDIDMGSEEVLGALFDEVNLDIKSCRNQCVFCFIDQMPRGLRPSLYVKDDDERMSFLVGNYITLTNLSEADIKRIVRYRIMPMNISVHTTDDTLRKKMLNNRFAGDVMNKLRYFADNHIAMNGQIVLCPGYNDGQHLVKTLNDLTSLYPEMVSVSVVPVGLTKYRKGLAPLKPLTREDAKKAIAAIEAVQVRMQAKGYKRFVYPADELFLLAQQPVPSADYYDGFPQIENGVGMIADFKANVLSTLTQSPPEVSEQKIGLITGTLAAPLIMACAEEIEAHIKGLSVRVFAVQNEFFGKDVTVSGLVTGGDICKQIPEDHGMDRFILPDNLFKSGENLLLDDTTAQDIQAHLGVPVERAAFDGHDLCRIIIKEK